MATALFRVPVHLAESAYGWPASSPGRFSSRKFDPLCLRLRNFQLASIGSSFPIKTRISSISSLGLQRTVLFAASHKPPRRIRSEASRERQTFTFSFYSVLWDIARVICRLPRIIWGLLTKEESTLNEIEEDVDKVADFVKEGAETIERTAKGVETIAEVVEEDAEKVVEVMDKVEKTTKTVHKELDDAFDTLEGSIENAEESADTIKKASRKEVQEKINDKEAKVTDTRQSPDRPSTPRAEDGTSKFSASNLMVANWVVWSDLWKGIHGNFLDLGGWIVPTLALALALVIVQLDAMGGLANPSLSLFSSKSSSSETQIIQ